MQLTKRLPSKSNKELMVFLHNVSNNVKPSQLERAAELKKAIYAEWSVRNKDFLAGRAVEKMQADGVLSAFGYRRSVEHTSELQSLAYLVCRLLLKQQNLRT